MDNLTPSSMATILYPLLPHVAVGISTPNKATRGHYQTWFFCTHQKLNSILLWWAVLSNPLKGWPRLGGSTNLIHSTAQRLRPMGSGLFSFTRNQPMTQNKSAHYSEQKITLENLHKSFAQLCHSYGDLNHYYGFSAHIDSKRIDWLLEEIESLAQAVEGLRFKGGL